MITNELILQAETREGRRNRGYQDHLGIWSIGVGHNVENGPPIPETAIDIIRDSDLDRVIQAIGNRWPWSFQLDPARQGVLIDMAFQMGIEGLAGFVNTLEFIRKGEWVNAAKNLLNSRYAGQTPGRANNNANQLLTGSWQ